MDTIAIECTRREGSGKEIARKMRVAGTIPAIVYGHGLAESVSVEVDPRALAKALQNPKGANALFALKGDGDLNASVMVREIQRHPVSRDLLHVDFVSPVPEREMMAQVPVRITGRSIGVQTGGRLRTPYREVRLRARPADLPAEVLLDITTLDQNETIMASQMPLPEGVEAVFDRDYVVVKIVAPRGKKTEEGQKPAKKKK